jgi:hypothetical protein
MSFGIRVLAAAAALLAVVPLVVLAQEHRTPSWMKVEKPIRLVRLNIITGWNANNGGLNYNGYYSGDMSVVVPPDWTVEIAFKNNDAMLPHSLLVTKPYEQDAFPDLAGTNQVALPRAYTDNPDQGIPSPKTDTVRFVAKGPGDFYFFCGAPGHGHGGMWTWFKIDAAAEAPYVVVDAGAEPGRE